MIIRQHSFVPRPKRGIDDASLAASASSIEDLREYVDAFRASSNRSRYALYIVIITSVLIGIATLNAHVVGWPLRRIQAWYDPLKFPQFFGGDTTITRIAREEYLRQFVGRGVMPASPIPGVSMDVNDLGVIGGIALVLLTLVMLFCLLREHENLQLALYKVRQLCVEDGAEHARGDSRANLLYHALAMGQVLASPPTLARWRRRGILRHFALIYFAPVGVQLWVFANNWHTKGIGALYGVDVNGVMWLQGTILFIIFMFSLSALLTSRAMAKRWKRAFYRVNPARRVAPQPTLLQWMKIPNLVRWITLAHKPRTTREEIGPRLITSLVDKLAITDSRSRDTVPVQCRILIWTERIQKTDAQRMLEELFSAGEQEAREWCREHGGAFDALVDFQPRQSDYVPLRNAGAKADWVVSGDWAFYYLPQADEARVPPESGPQGPSAAGAWPQPAS